MLFPRGLYRSGDAGGGGGGQPPATTLPAGQQTTGDGTGAPPAGAPNAGQQVQFSAEQQAAIDRVIAERLTRAKEKWDTDQQTAKKKADEDAEKERLKQAAEWQKLAEQHEARVKALEPLESQVKAYGEAVDALLAAKVKELGDAAKTAVEALPGTPSPLDRLHWLTANEGLFAKPQQGGGVGTPPRDKTRTPATAPAGEGSGQAPTERRWVQF